MSGDGKMLCDALAAIENFEDFRAYAKLNGYTPLSNAGEAWDVWLAEVIKGNYSIHKSLKDSGIKLIRLRDVLFMIDLKCRFKAIFNYISTLLTHELIEISLSCLPVSDFYDIYPSVKYLRLTKKCSMGVNNVQLAQSDPVDLIQIGYMCRYMQNYTPLFKVINELRSERENDLVSALDDCFGGKVVTTQMREEAMKLLVKSCVILKSNLDSARLSQEKSELSEKNAPNYLDEKMQAIANNTEYATSGYGYVIRDKDVVNLVNAMDVYTLEHVVNYQKGDIRSEEKWGDAMSTLVPRYNEGRLKPLGSLTSSQVSDMLYTLPKWVSDFQHYAKPKIIEILRSDFRNELKKTPVTVFTEKLGLYLNEAQMAIRVGTLTEIFSNPTMKDMDDELIKQTYHGIPLNDLMFDDESYNRKSPYIFVYGVFIPNPTEL
jgi:hypothetical protein